MTSIIKLQPFSGAHNESPPCYMLQVDEFRFLLDCGWDEDFSMEFIKEIKRLVKLQVTSDLCGYNCKIMQKDKKYNVAILFEALTDYN
jgi:cleavage and polyadenylation specificity factor subunit 2